MPNIENIVSRNLSKLLVYDISRTMNILNKDKIRTKLGNFTVSDIIMLQILKERAEEIASNMCITLICSSTIKRSSSYQTSQQKFVPATPCR